MCERSVAAAASRSLGPHVSPADMHTAVQVLLVLSDPDIASCMSTGICSFGGGTPAWTPPTHNGSVRDGIASTPPCSPA